MGEGTFTDTNWPVVGLAVIGLSGFVASFLVGQQRTDAEWIVAKYTLRFEAPAIGVFLLGYAYYPTNEVLIAGVVVLLVISGVAMWFAYMETKDLERQGKLAKRDDTR
jgi:hypothetical protein